ncbi:MAG: ribosome small subunit-dependent GTPase A [Fimbriimonadaceae bacterium]
MDNKRRTELASRLAGLDSNERKKLYKRAAMLRKASRRPERSGVVVDDSDDAAPAYRKRPPASLQDLVFRLLEQELIEPEAAGSTLAEGTVVWLGRLSCRVRTADGELECEISRELARDQQTSLAVGDVAVVRSTGETRVVRSVLPRRTRLSRPDPGNSHIERVIVANVDLVVVTVSVKTPPLHPRLIDRFVLAIEKGGAEAALCVNKLDLLTDAEERATELGKLEPYKAAGLAIVECSAVNRQGMKGVHELIAGKTCAFVGHSGVGKSSILNALRPQLGLETRSVSEGYGRGRHTTTASSLYDLGGGTRLIDTPGIRSFGLWQMGAAEIAGYFPEFGSLERGCKFRDCSHIHEPGCAVKQALAAGDLSRHRYDTYLRLVADE